MSIEDKKTRNVYKPQMIIRLPECPEYDHFTEIMSEKYDTVIAHDTDDMIEMVMGPREHLAWEDMFLQPITGITSMMPMTANGPSGARQIWTSERTKKMHSGHLSLISR